MQLLFHTDVFSMRSRGICVPQCLKLHIQFRSCCLQMKKEQVLSYCRGIAGQQQCLSQNQMKVMKA